MATHQLAPVLRHVRAIADPTPVVNLTDSALLVRFVSRDDEAAFSELVRRQGPLVLGICQRILGDVHAAEDAFQGTFLLLARKAHRLRHPERLGPWLYGVARRVALKARTMKSRRREVAAVDVAADSRTECDDVRLILDDAIARLPPRDRTPVVMCYFQGLTYTEAACRLRCPPGTVSARLARARARLRVLLTRRGIAPAAGAIAAALATDSLAATVPVSLRRLAVHCAVGGATIPASVLTLTKGVGHAMIFDKTKLLAAVAMLGMAGTGAWVYGPVAAQSPMDKPSTAIDKPAVRDDPKPVAEITRNQTINFDVMAPSAEMARQFGEAAERERKAQAVLWLGVEMPTWPKRCPLYMKPTMGGSGGATKINYDFRGNYEILSMDLEGDLHKMLTATLPHEMTHIVLAHHFRYPVPRWADEGAAVSAEPNSEQRHHDKLTRQYLIKKSALPLRRLLELKDYGETTDAMVVYAQGFSVTRFLIDRKDRATFLRFVERGMATGWDVAAKVCYDFESVEALEVAWLADLRATVDQTQFTDEPAPIPVVASLTGPERIKLTWSVRYTVKNFTKGYGEQLPGGDFRIVAGESAELSAGERLIEMKLAHAVTPDGKHIDAKALAERLRQPAVALMAAGQSLPNRFHLQLLKEDAIIFLGPFAEPPAVPKE